MTDAWNTPWVAVNMIPDDWMKENARRFNIPLATLRDSAGHYDRETAPLDGGIYFLFLEGRLVYIGETDSIHPRLIQHSRNKEFDGYTVMLEVPPLYRTEIENYLIHKFKPPLNVKYEPVYGVFSGMLDDI